MVNPHNLANQIFRQQDVGRSKVEALADILFELNPEVKDELKLYPDGWNGQKLEQVFLHLVVRPVGGVMLGGLQQGTEVQHSLDVGIVEVLLDLLAF